MNRHVILICVLFLITISAFPSLAAPAFSLPDIETGEYVSSDELFSRHQNTFLVFWESGCPHCVEALRECEEFHLEYGGSDIGVAGINCDEGDILDIRGIISEGGVTFPQLRDRGRHTAAEYGVPLSTFTIFLVDGTGRIVSRSIGPEGNAKSEMERMILDGPEEQKDPPGRPVPYGITIGGDVRVRFLSVDTRGEGAAGPYGEPIEPGNSFLHRLELAVSKKIGKYLTAGGLLRVSNESLDVLRGGPDYFDSEYGSVFAGIETRGFTLRLGYFPVSMTPLTLMRWDWDDNPRVAGDAGCGCGTAAGVLLVETLEQLGPDLRFEGALADWSGGDLSVKAFYAIPRRARDIKVTHSTFGGEEAAAYSLETAGAEAKWRRFVERTDSYIEAGAHFIYTWEDPFSVDPIELGYSVPFERYQSSVLSLSGTMPVLRSLDAIFEMAVLGRTRQYNLGPDSDETVETDGLAGIGGLEYRSGLGVKVRCDYLMLESGFHSPFAAMSYQSGMEGVRISSLIEPPLDGYLLSAFYKRLIEGDELPAGLERSKASTLGISVDADYGTGLGWSLGYMNDSDWRGGSILDFESSRDVISASLRMRFDPNSFIQAQYQYIDISDDSEGDPIDSGGELFSLFLITKF